MTKAATADVAKDFQCHKRGQDEGVVSQRPVIESRLAPPQAKWLCVPKWLKKDLGAAHGCSTLVYDLVQVQNRA